MITILFSDLYISKTKTEHVLCNTFNLTLFDFVQELRNQLKVEDELTKEMNSFMIEGNLIPTGTLERFLEKHLEEIKTHKVLLSGYPKTPEQFLGLLNLLKRLHISIEQIWYIKQRDPEVFMNEYLKNQNSDEWIHKYGGEFAQTWQKQFMANRANIDGIKQLSGGYTWKIIDMDFKNELTEQFILQKIKNLN